MRKGDSRKGKDVEHDRLAFASNSAYFRFTLTLPQ